MRETKKLAKEIEAERQAKRRKAEQRATKKLRDRKALPPFDQSLRYTVDEAALYLRCSRAHLYRLIKIEELPTIQDGRRTYVPGAAIAERSRVAA
jgi:excisionase family DNA binding protein